MENQVSTGLSQFTGGAAGLVTSGMCIGAPATVATTAGVYAPGCTLYQRDSSTGYRIVAWQNTGTSAVPSWTSLASANVVSGSGATVTLTKGQSGSVVLFDRAAGIVFTLPANSPGMVFDFFTSVTITSNAAKVITAAGTELLVGTIINTDTDSSDAVASWKALVGSSYIAVSMNGSTTGGIKGDSLRFTCLNSTTWNVTGFTLGTGSVATPFATS